MSRAIELVLELKEEQRIAKVSNCICEKCGLRDIFITSLDELVEDLIRVQDDEELMRHQDEQAIRSFYE